MKSLVLCVSLMAALCWDNCSATKKEKGGATFYYPEYRPMYYPVQVKHIDIPIYKPVKYETARIKYLDFKIPKFKAAPIDYDYIPVYKVQAPAYYPPPSYQPPQRPYY